MGKTIVPQSDFTFADDIFTLRGEVAIEEKPEEPVVKNDLTAPLFNSEPE